MRPFSCASARVPSACAVLAFSFALAKPARADSVATLEVELSLQSCREDVSGLTTCEEAKVLATPVEWSPAPSDTTFSWEADVSRGLRLRAPASAKVFGVLSKGESGSRPALCLEALDIRVSALPDDHTLRVGPLCVPATGGSTPLFAFSSWRPEGDRTRATFALGVVGAFRVAPVSPGAPSASGPLAMP